MRGMEKHLQSLPIRQSYDASPSWVEYSVSRTMLVRFSVLSSVGANGTQSRYHEIVRGLTCSLV